MTFLYLCFSDIKKMTPKSQHGKDKTYLEIQDKILGEGGYTENTREQHITVLSLLINTL